jgi:hypothetical protein
MLTSNLVHEAQQWLPGNLLLLLKVRRLFSLLNWVRLILVMSLLQDRSLGGLQRDLFLFQLEVVGTTPLPLIIHVNTLLKHQGA